MKEMLQFAVAIAREAGGFLAAGLNRKREIEFKGEINIVTDADRRSEEIIVSGIRKRFPSHGILAEESSEVLNGSEFRWIVDPLDGTTNYAHGYPVFCVSIALEKSGRVLLGVIYNPMLDELFTAERDGGALLNGNPIRVSRTGELSRSLLATGFPYDIRSTEDNNLNYFSALAVRAQAIRRAGSAALDLAYTACGRFDGFWELKLHPWDTAAAVLLVSEAGGKVTDLFGGDYTIGSPHILATNGHIHESMIHVLRKTARGAS